VTVQERADPLRSTAGSVTPDSLANPATTMPRSSDAQQVATFYLQ
jgi:hypothetical protein